MCTAHYFQFSGIDSEGCGWSRLVGEVDIRCAREDEGGGGGGGMEEGGGRREGWALMCIRVIAR